MRPAPRAPRPHATPVPAALRLQRLHGNRYVRRLLATRDGDRRVQRSTALERRLREALEPRQAGAARRVQRALDDQIRAQLDIVGPPNLNGIIALIHGSTTTERRAALSQAPLRQLIRDRLGDSAPLVMSSLLEGSQHWRNPPANDFFDFFVTNNGSGPLPNTATMNCWESILYSAYLSGRIAVAWIHNFYTAALAAPDPNALIWQQLGWHAGLPFVPPTVPAAGQLLYWYTAGQQYPGHVALSLGGDQAISLWNQPNNEYAVQRIRIADLPGTVQVGNAPW